MPDISNQKHAYLIMAHTNFSQLQTLISLLDHPQNDIYLHVDKRASGFQPNQISVNHSSLVIIDRIRVNWGGHSQITCELNLLKASVPKQYRYYHLLSGSDLPLRSQKEIHSFYDNAYPHNFIRFDMKSIESGAFHHRIDTFHLLQDYFGKNTGFVPGLLRRVENLSLGIQKRIGIRRKRYIQPYKGTNWFSITHELAQYVLSRERLIRKQFYHTVCADEVFLHSIVMDSPYRETLINNSLRAIDWTRGDPYVFREEDVDGLLDSECMFARKFDEKVDPAAINKVVSCVRKGTQIDKLQVLDF